MPSIKKENLRLTLAISAILSVPACQDSDTNTSPEPTPAEESQVLQSPEEQQINAFDNSSYTYDDAVLLAEFWGKATPWDAKLKMGGFLLNGDSDLLQQSLNNARNNQTAVTNEPSEEQQRAAFFNSEYSYEDAVLLAELWGKATPWDAKLKMGNFLLNGDNDLLQQSLNNAKNNQTPVVAQSTEEQQINAFSNSTYTYDDAVLLAEFWGKATPWEAKLKMGRLLINNDKNAIDQAIKHFLG